jgi:hypothetical protein
MYLNTRGQRDRYATWIFLHVAYCWPRGLPYTWPQSAASILPRGNFFFFFPPKKYHKNIKTTFEIYHEHKIKLHKSIINNVFVNYTNQHNNIYKSEDHVLINVFITNKTKLHRISTNLKTVSRITNSHTRRVFTNRRLLRLRWYSGRWCLNGGVLAQLSSNRRQRTNRCRITCK